MRLFGEDSKPIELSIKYDPGTREFVGTNNEPEVVPKVPEKAADVVARAISREIDKQCGSGASPGATGVNVRGL